MKNSIHDKHCCYVNAAVEGILEAEIHGTHEVKSLQEYHKAIKD